MLWDKSKVSRKPAEGRDALAAAAEVDGTKKTGQSFAKYIEEKLARKLSTTARPTGTSTNGPMAALRRAPIKPGEAQDYRPTVSEVLAADRQRENCRERKGKEKKGLTRYGVTTGRDTKKKHKSRGKN